LKKWGILGAILAFLALGQAVKDFPIFGDPQQPASVHVVPRYVEKTIEETGVPNALTSVITDYRGYDTNYETTVIFTAGLSVTMILGGVLRWRKNGKT
jgi:multicomponent Na+:H+ antiporter subunit B